MDAGKKAHMKGVLKQQIRELSDVIEAEDNRLKDKPRNYDTNRSRPTHLADIGTDTMEQEKTSMRRSQNINHLHELQAALTELEEGYSYGICEVCGREISQERLEEIPTTTLCAEDARQIKE